MTGIESLPDFSFRRRDPDALGSSMKGLLSLRDRNKLGGFDRSRLGQSVGGCRRRSATEDESRRIDRARERS
jgi:hypothetical protein